MIGVVLPVVGLVLAIVAPLIALDLLHAAAGD